MVEINFSKSSTTNIILTPNGVNLAISVHDFVELIGGYWIEGIYILLFDHNAGKNIKNISAFQSNGSVIWSLSPPKIGSGAPSPWSSIGIDQIKNRLFLQDFYGWGYVLENPFTPELGPKVFMK